MKNPRALGRTLILVPPVAGVIALCFVAPISQPESYHAFADHRAMLGIPDFWNVISNLPFALVGMLGLRAFQDHSSRFLFADLPAGRELWIALFLYILAKVAESRDAQIFSVFVVSGHTVKHLLAGFSTYWIYRWRRGADPLFHNAI